MRAGQRAARDEQRNSPDAARQLGYRPELDGIRAIAIALVVAGHYAGWGGSSVFGVDLFFVLSGFLITVLLLEEREARGTISLRRFYLRRLLRLGPALALFALALTALTLLGAATGHHVGPPGTGAGMLEVLFAVTYTVNLALIWLPQHVAAPDVHVLWSLAVEEQFYLVWPAVLVAALLRKRATLVAPAAVATAVVVGIVVLRIANAPEGPPGALDVAAVTRFDSILVGCLVALLYRSNARETALRVAGRPFVWIPALAAASLLVMAADPRHFWDGRSTIFCVLSAIVLLSILDVGSRFARLLALPPLVLLGRISYPLYLWHLAMLVWLSRAGLFDHLGTTLGRLIALGAALACAIVSYRFVELPFLRLKWRLAPTRSHDVALPEAIGAARLSG